MTLERSARLLGLSLALCACTTTPSPLAPGQRGSVGVPHLGVQTSAEELPVRGYGFERFRPRSPNYWGAPRLVALIQEAAAHVQRQLPGTPPLVVGDLSARGGGKIPGHNSHRTGRDVDLLYYVTTPEGAPLRSPGFFSHSSDLLAEVDPRGQYLRFDVARNWELFKYLLSRENVGIQFLFVSRDIEAMLIDYALSRHEPIDLVYRAQTVLLEPKDSLPHNDHVHVRISCTPEEGFSGCSGGGPYWSWLPALPVPTPLGPGFFTAIAEEDPIEFEKLAGGTGFDPDDV